MELWMIVAFVIAIGLGVQLNRIEKRLGVIVDLLSAREGESASR